MISAGETRAGVASHEGALEEVRPSGLSSLTVTYGYVIADQSMTCSMVTACPGSSVEPQRNPGEKAISVPFTFISASRITWSTLPLKLPRR